MKESSLIPTSDREPPHMKKKKRRIATKLEEVFGIPFAQLINENFSKGDSRYDVQKKLLEMIVEKNLVEQAIKAFPESKGKWDCSKWSFDSFGAISVDSNPAFRPSTLYHAIKDGKDQGEINFDFHISNKGRKINSVVRKPMFRVEFKCTHCGKKHRNHTIGSIEDLNLRVYACPNCQTFGKCVATINDAGKISHRAIVKIDGIRQEVFVKSETDLTPLETETVQG